MVFEPVSGKVISANGSAIAWFGYDPTRGPALDRAMPAMQEIAAVAHGSSHAQWARPLLFWTPNGTRQLTARLVPEVGTDGARIVRLTTAPVVGDPGVERVRMLEGGHERLAPRRSRLTESARVPSVEMPRRPRTDTDTLREIARRIREGHAQRLADIEPLTEHDAPRALGDVATPVTAAAAYLTPAPDPIESATLERAIDPAPDAADGQLSLARSAGMAADTTHPQPGPTSAAYENNARLAHELRTPLGAISALAEIMRDERLGPLANARYRDYADDIHKSAQHALSVVTAMLAIDDAPRTAGSAIERLSFTDVDLDEVARECLAALAPAATDAGITHVIDVPDRLPRVVADRRTIKQVLLNLLTNAIRATGRGGSVTVRIGYDLAGPVRLEVRDTGIGMTDEQIGRVFAAEPGTAERAGERAGFGLPLAIAMADANGASLAIGSEPGIGTRVSLIFDKDRVVPV